MALINLRVLDGPDRGAVFENLPTPVTVGREEGNHVQLRDERVSRYHLKIQEDQGRLVLTDLQSTNGTRVNGEEVQICRLRPGDLILIGRSVLLFGSRQEILERLAELRSADLSGAVPLGDLREGHLSTSFALEREFQDGTSPDLYGPLHVLLPPELPSGLGPGQAAQLVELLQYIHLRLRTIVRSCKIQAFSEQVIMDHRTWQNLLDLYDRIAGYLEKGGEPSGADPDDSAD